MRQLRASKITLFKDFAEFLSFRDRRRVVLGVLVSSVTGTFYWLMPAVIRWWFFYVYAGLTGLFIASQATLFVKLAGTNISFLFSRGKYKRIPYLDPEVDALARRMGIGTKVKVFATDDPRVKASTNPFTSTIYFSAEWLRGLLSKSEILGVFGHEFGHITRIKQFVIEIILAVVLSYAFAWGLYFFTVFVLSTALLALVFNVAEIAIAMLLVNFVCWRAEYRSDKESAKVNGPEGLISVFQLIGEPNDGSETHPPSLKRIRRLEGEFPSTV